MAHIVKRVAVGSELESYCGRCKLVLNHVVTAMVEGLPRRVRCLTCQSEHNHRAAKPKTTRSRSATGTRKTSTATKTAAALSRWREAIARWDQDSAKKYSIYDSFGVDDQVIHSKFGQGIVIEVPTPDRIITLFESGEKMLMHGRQR